MENPGQGKKNALIIGGSSGIGRAVALALAKQGHNLWIHGSQNSQWLQKTSAEANQLGAITHCWEHTFSTVADFMDSIPTGIEPDIVVLAFGPFLMGSLGETTISQWQEIIDANLTLPGAVLSRFGPIMARKGFGRIILFGGTGTDQIKAYRDIAAYSAAKTALGVLAKSAAREWGPKNVSCNVICPGYVKTENIASTLEMEARRRMPNGKLQTTENMANLVLSIINDSENGLNGAILSSGHGL